MTTVFNPPPPQNLAATSPYASILEYVAPGIVAIVDGQRNYNEQWWDVLHRTLISIDATDDQRSILAALCERAAGGIAPPTTADIVHGEAVSVKPDWGKLLSGIGVAITLLNALG